MFEKCNPSHPDKVADRIAGAMVDYAYRQSENPKIAVEVLIGHGTCLIISETNIHIKNEVINAIVTRITGRDDLEIIYKENKQDQHLADNQANKPRCGDNGIFKGTPLKHEEAYLSKLVMDLYKEYPTDGKFILSNGTLIACQSNCDKEEIQHKLLLISNDIDSEIEHIVVNPLGDWTGGTDVDCGATNRKLGSDMGMAITGGGLHGKDLSKGDVAINIYAYLKAQTTNKTVELSCAIGDESVDGKPYSQIVKIAKRFIDSIGGFEKFAEWGFAIDYWRYDHESFA